MEQKEASSIDEVKCDHEKIFLAGQINTNDVCWKATFNVRTCTINFACGRIMGAKEV